MLTLTEQGAALLREVRPVVRRAQEVMLKQLAPGERDTLVALLSKVTTAENDLSRAPLRPVEGASANGKPTQGG